MDSVLAAFSAANKTLAGVIYCVERIPAFAKKIETTAEVSTRPKCATHKFNFSSGKIDFESASSIYGNSRHPLTDINGNKGYVYLANKTSGQWGSTAAGEVWVGYNRTSGIPDANQGKTAGALSGAVTRNNVACCTLSNGVARDDTIRQAGFLTMMGQCKAYCVSNNLYFGICGRASLEDSISMEGLDWGAVKDVCHFVSPGVTFTRRDDSDKLVYRTPFSVMEEFKDYVAKIKWIKTTYSVSLPIIPYIQWNPVKWKNNREYHEQSTLTAEQYLAYYAYLSMGPKWMWNVSSWCPSGETNFFSQFWNTPHTNVLDNMNRMGIDFGVNPWTAYRQLAVVKGTPSPENTKYLVNGLLERTITTDTAVF
jgi:hypothetical protein